MRARAPPIEKSPGVPLKCPEDFSPPSLDQRMQKFARVRIGRWKRKETDEDTLGQQENENSCERQTEEFLRESESCCENRKPVRQETEKVEKVRNLKTSCLMSRNWLMTANVAGAVSAALRGAASGVRSSSRDARLTGKNP